MFWNVTSTESANGPGVAVILQGLPVGAYLTMFDDRLSAICFRLFAETGNNRSLRDFEI